jgi:diacylglycerol O-acyltransferase
VVFKVHHCMMDGAGGAVASVALLVDADLPPSTQRSRFQRASRASLTWREKTRRAGSGARTLARMLARQADPAAGTSLDVPIGPSRHLTFVDAPLGQLAAIKSRYGGTINDVVLTATVGGLRTLLQRRGERPLPTHLKVMVPVNMRTGDEERAITVNVSLFNVSIPLADEDPLVRYRRTVAVTKQMKQRRQAALDQGLVDLAAVVPPALQRMMMRWAHPLGHFDVMVTNVPGPGGTLTVLGAPLVRVLPIVPPTMGHALNVGVFSYGDSVTFGVNADPVAVPDVEVVKEGIHQTLTELHAARPHANFDDSS